jgi:hypothetical protein
MPSVICYSRYLIAFCQVFIITFLLASTGLAQEASTKRGFQPGNSFAIGDLETINTTNGNLMLRFPLAGLPAGRNGLAAGINLYYNSKLYDSETAYFSVDNQSCQIVGTEPGILVCPYYQKSLLKESVDGGWRFGMGYSLRLIDRHDQFVTMPMERQPQCWNPNLYGGSPGYFEMRYHYKLMLIMPDGSSHEMRPNGWNDGNFNDPLGDWFDIRPDGYWFDCVTPQPGIRTRLPTTASMAVTCGSTSSMTATRSQWTIRGRSISLMAARLRATSRTTSLNVFTIATTITSNFSVMR